MNYSLKVISTLMFGLLLPMTTWAQSQKIEIVSQRAGQVLQVNGQPMVVNGMNWDYYPVGTNYSYSLWNQSESTIKAALAKEMPMLKNMGVNAVRIYTGIPKKWIEYIYDRYGIYTMLNHSFGRYGLTIDGAWIANTDYANPKAKALLIKEVQEMVTQYQGTRGLLIYLLGNENNYGLFWEGAETEDIPIQDRKSTQKAEAMYKLFNEAVKSMKSVDKQVPIAICNGDLLFLDLIAKECPDVDILGINVYRGISFGDLFERVKNEYGKPVLLTEFGSDAFNALTQQEEQSGQAAILKGNWHEIYQNVSGMGKSGNVLGAFTFQFSDGWWKYGQTKYLDVHDTHASWSNGGYSFDYVEGENNMNEEWFGVCAKGETNAAGLYELYPRAGYYVLQEVHQFNPFAQGSNASSLERHFDQIQIINAELKARSDQAVQLAQRSDKIRLSRFSSQFTTFHTGGSLITTPEAANPAGGVYPNRLGFDHLQSFFVGVEAKPSANMTANVEFNVLGNVAQNPIDEIFYENRGRPLLVNSDNGDLTINDNERFQIYRAGYTWDHPWFNLNGFYRTGHYHWGYEGDFFGLYPEANYGPMIDLYNGGAPLGFEMEGKKALKDLKVAFGPQLWWGANPAVLLKYGRAVRKSTVTAVYHEDLQKQANTESSFAIPQPQTRRLTLHLKRKFGKLQTDLGGIWAGQPLNGRTYQVQRGEEGNLQVYQHQIESKDNWGGKVKLTYEGGKFNWYGQAAAQGLVANGGADLTQTFTGWRLKDSGSGNQYNFLTGFTTSFGNVQFAPNFLWQKPIEGPISTAVPAPGRPRNILSDPFVVRANREQIAGELLLTYDPTPGSWMYEWDNDRAEDAKFAMNLGFVYRHLPTTQDAAIGILPDGRSTFPFPGAPPAKDLWEIHSRIVSKINPDLGIIANLFGGTAQANGSDARTIHRAGAELRMIMNKTKLMTAAKVNDWGPFDYHRDFNLTFPVQLMADLSTDLGKPDWFALPGTRLGIRGTWRSLDRYSPRYNPAQMLDSSGNWVPNPNAVGFPNGTEWEIRTYLHVNIGK